MKSKKIAGLGIRLLAGIIDIFIFLLIFLFSSLIAVYNNKVHSIIGYYFWFLIIIVYILIVHNLIPFLFKGFTIGKFICKIKYESLKKESISFQNIFKKELLYWNSLMISIIFWVLFVSPDLSEKLIISRQNKNTNNLSNKEVILASIGPLYFTFSLTISSVFTLTILNKNKIGFNDYFSKIVTTYKNKFIEQKKYEEFIIVSKDRKLKKFEWEF